MISRRPVVARISGEALAHNLDVVRNFAPGVKVLAVVKANAYGHGLNSLIPWLGSADGLAIVGLDPAIQCREAFADKLIVLLEGPFNADELVTIAAYRLAPVIHSTWQIELLENFSHLSFPTIFLKFNSGMNRLGFDREGGLDAYHRLSGLPGVGKVILMSHLACADDVEDTNTQRQTDQFESMTESLTGEKSLANSAGVAGWPETHYQWVRPGIMLYGGSPLLHQSADRLELKPVMTLESRLIAIQSLKKGDAVGYGQTWACPEDMSVGVAACGYGDGYPRHAPSGTPVLVNGKRAQLVGRVSMDTIIVDLRGVDAKVDDPVILWGDGLPADDIATAAGTIAYELFTGVSARVPRILAHG